MNIVNKYRIEKFSGEFYNGKKVQNVQDDGADFMKKYAFVGASIRSLTMYPVNILRRYSDAAKMTGIYDPNHKRAALFRKKAGDNIPTYSSFEEMIHDAQPDIVIITAIDRYHHEYIIKTLEAGIDAVTEKPMTIDEEKCNAILEAERRTGRKVIVTFNYRYTPYAERLKELVKSGIIGKILSVHFEWMLDTDHGADYFRRWHRRKENSGGLLVHKSTHHFDLVNWLLEEEPVAVSAFGNRRFYGPTREERGTRCLSCNYKESCEFYFDIHKKITKNLYLDCEDIDGYIRDSCVFSEEIDIEDTLCVNVKYSQGAVMSYSLTAYSPYEGHKLTLNGTGGRLEFELYSGKVGPFAGENICKFRLYNRKGEEMLLESPASQKNHGGGDERFLHALLKGDASPDPLGRMAGSREGALSAIIGIAANKSIAEGRSVYIKDILKLY
jgi:predicted dehydrogenase